MIINYCDIYVDFKFVFLENSVYVNTDPMATNVNSQLIYACVSLKGREVQRGHCRESGWPHVGTTLTLCYAREP